MYQKIIQNYGTCTKHKYSTQEYCAPGEAKEYAYEGYYNPIKVTYPTGLVITRTYDHDGAVLTVQKGEGSDASTLFTGTAMNGLGKYTAYSYGNGKTSTESPAGARQRGMNPY